MNIKLDAFLLEQQFKLLTINKVKLFMHPFFILFFCNVLREKVLIDNYPDVVVLDSLATSQEYSIVLLVDFTANLRT